MLFVDRDYRRERWTIQIKAHLMRKPSNWILFFENQPLNLLIPHIILYSYFWFLSHSNKEILVSRRKYVQLKESQYFFFKAKTNKTSHSSQSSEAINLHGWHYFRICGCYSQRCQWTIEAWWRFSCSHCPKWWQVNIDTDILIGLSKRNRMNTSRNMDRFPLGKLEWQGQEDSNANGSFMLWGLYGKMYLFLIEMII